MCRICFGYLFLHWNGYKMVDGGHLGFYLTYDMSVVVFGTYLLGGNKRFEPAL